MIIIVEGPDLSGKTVAIKKMAKEFNSGFTLKNNYKPKTSAKENTAKIYNQYINILGTIDAWIDVKDVVILDRFYPSQIVYSYLRGEDEFKAKNDRLQFLEEYCSNSPFLYVYVDTPLNVLETRYQDRGDDYIDYKELKNLKARYDRFYLYTEMKKIKIDTTTDNWIDKVREGVGTIYALFELKEDL